MKMIAIGPLWRGSDAGGLFRALSRAGCLIEIMDEFYFISLQTKSKLTKVAERLIRHRQVNEFNNAIIRKIALFQPDVVLVYKGTFVRAETLRFAKRNNCRLLLFYPDVSTTAHGPYIPLCIPLYDDIFTTKTFGITDMKVQFGVKDAFFIPHGFDPEIHRPLTITKEIGDKFGCDASFIGTWSPKKEKWLAILKKSNPGINLKIWGGQWFKASDPALRGSIQLSEVHGDLYAIALQSSKINLGILSERVAGSSAGDLITSRTFHITGTSGFMLHERNEESILYYKENEECGFFDGPEELSEKVAYFLGNEPLRERIRLAGYQRALSEHSLDARARFILKVLEE